MGSRFRAVAMVIAGLAVAVTGCSNSMSADDFKTELTNNGVTPELATCIVNELQAGGFKFRKYGDLTNDENQQLIQASTNCALNQAGLSTGSSPSVPPTTK